MNSRKTYANINLKNLRNNYKFLAKQSTHPFVCCMVKANAYGHGDEECVSVLLEEGCSDYGVALVEEGVKLKNRFADQVNIFLFGALSEAGLKDVVDNQIIPVVFSWSELELIAKNVQKPIPIHLKFNIGMNRLGFSLEDVDKLKAFIDENKHIKLEGLCAHMPSAENLTQEKSSSIDHENNFKKIIDCFQNKKLLIHLYNSAALLSEKNKNYGCRVGIALYGVDPFYNTEFAKSEIKPVMSLYAEIIKVNYLEAGDAVSYDETWVASEKTKVAVLSIGYADGMRWSLSNKGQVCLEGQVCKILGRVCMDYTMVDVSHIALDPKDLEGKLVLVFGDSENKNCHPANVAKIAQTIAYELFTGISFRVQRIYSNV